MTGCSVFAPRGIQTDVYHGDVIPDPYRWLEDPQSKETKEWVEAQISKTDAYLKNCPLVDKIRKKLEEVQNFPRRKCTFKRNNWYFFYKNTGLQNQSVLYRQKVLGSTEAELVLDPNSLSDDGTAALNILKISRDAKYLAYGVSYSGSDWVTIFVKDLDSGEILSDKLNWVKFSCLEFTKDSKGFFYCAYEAPESLKKNTLEDSSESSRGTETDVVQSQKLFFHRIGTPQQEDILIFQNESKPKDMFGCCVSTCGTYCFISGNDSCEPVNDLSYIRIDEIQTPKPVWIVQERDAGFHHIATLGDKVYFLSNSLAPKYKLVSYDLKDQQFEDVIPEGPHLLSSARIAHKEYLIVEYSVNVQSQLSLFDLKGNFIQNIELKLPGSVSSISSNYEENEIFFDWSTFTHPGIGYVFNVESRILDIVVETTSNGFNPEDYVVKQVFFPSKDGTKIPMFLVHHQDLTLDGHHPCLLYGYGGFNISIEPYFSTSAVLFAGNLRGVYAVANIRGGGEYGNEWHDAGKLSHKQNVFDDFQSAAQYLIRKNYTSSEKLIIEGGSNGGLLVATCANQSPELFKCVIAHVGVMDMLRFHKFTIGYAWISDYGCSDKPEDYHILKKYSPLHNVSCEKSRYPSMILTTADHDDRVVPLHSYKLTAELQHTLGKDPKHCNPILIRIDLKAGHGAGKPLSKTLSEKADCYGFAAKEVGATWRDI